MYCPNCGNKNSESQKFCRSCGLGLEKVAQSLIEQLPTKADRSLQERKERLERLGMAALSVFGLGVLGLIFYVVFYKLMYTQGRIVEGLAFLGFMAFIGCALLSTVLFAKANELKEASAKRQIEAPPADASTGKLLDPHREPAYSVTDRTTELLAVNKRERSSD